MSLHFTMVPSVHCCLNFLLRGKNLTFSALFGTWLMGLTVLMLFLEVTFTDIFKLLSSF